MIVPHSERTVYRLRVPLAIAQVLATVVISLGVFLLIFANLYQNMRQNMAELRTLRIINRQQQEQLAYLSAEAGSMKESLRRLSDLDRELRQMMNQVAAYGKASIPAEVQVAADGSATEATSAGSDHVSTDGGPNPVTTANIQRPDRDLPNRSLDRGRELQAEMSRINGEMSAREQSLEGLKAALAGRLAYLDAKPSIWPTRGHVTSGFGWRPSPFGKRGEFHDGYDIAAPYGTAIVATGAGRVVFAGWRGAYGRAVMLDHGYGLVTLYGHTSRIVVSVGQRVKRGQVIAYVGSTGRSTGPHLHYTVLVNGREVSPRPYLPGN